jgi:hypothetical protein
MPNPLYAMPSNAKLSRPLMTTAAAVLSLGLFASFGPASAAPMQPPQGLANSGVTVEVGYKRHKNSRWIFTNQVYGPEALYVPQASYRTYHVTPYSEQSDEIRELRRAFPSTNWPPSDRY